MKGFENSNKNLIDVNAQMYKVNPIKWRDKVFYDLDSSIKKNEDIIKSFDLKFWEAYEIRKQV